MSNKTKTQSSKTLNRKEKALKKVSFRDEVYITYQKFHGSYLAIISNLTDRETHAYGRTKLIAGRNAVRNYKLKYVIE